LRTEGSNSIQSAVPYIPPYGRKKVAIARLEKAAYQRKEFSMKRTFLAGFALLLALALVSCGDYFSPPEKAEDGEPSVQYVTDGGALKSVTIRIDGQGGPDRKMSRALSKELAQTAHDYFEVVFKDGTDIARASWELGYGAVIKRVPLIDYEKAAGIGDPEKAILFVGRKTDKTLLAVGLLTGVDGSSTDLEIKSTSTTATFTVVAFKAGLDLDDPSDSNFCTGSELVPGTATAASTIIRKVENKTTGEKFPMHWIPAGKTVAAIYEIELDHTTALIANYKAGIVVADAPPSIQVKNPRYTSESDGETYELPPPHASSTEIIYTSNDAAGAFSEKTEFSIDTTGTNNEGVIAFTFEIPVYAINGGSSLNNIDPVKWFVRPSLRSSSYDLDNGNTGGSILLGIGDSALGSIEIIASGP
jgi:hypothetical protein